MTQSPVNRRGLAVSAELAHAAEASTRDAGELTDLTLPAHAPLIHRPRWHWRRGRPARPPSNPPIGVTPTASEVDHSDELVVATLNLAHGRSVGLHQVLTRRARIEENLRRVAELLIREGPHVVALQEADGPSVWSGRFNHVEYVAEQAGYVYHLRGDHVATRRLSYGTALLSRHALSDPLSVTFRPSPPTPSKGFVLTTVVHPASPTGGVDVVSLHLDFARASVRRRQMEHLAEVLDARPHPRVVMGDFNTEWRGAGCDLESLAGRLSLAAHAPFNREFVTFGGRRGRRLDWILVSEHLRFDDYRVLPDRVSDHRAVVARLRLRDKGLPENK